MGTVFPSGIDVIAEPTSDLMSSEAITARIGPVPSDFTTDLDLMKSAVALEIDGPRGRYHRCFRQWQLRSWYGPNVDVPYRDMVLAVPCGLPIAMAAAAVVAEDDTETPIATTTATHGSIARVKIDSSLVGPTDRVKLEYRCGPSTPDPRAVSAALQLLAIRWTARDSDLKVDWSMVDNSLRGMGLPDMVIPA